MLSLRIEKLGTVTVIHCAGRIVFPYTREFRIRLLQQLQTRTLVLNLVDTIAIDASGLGLLVSLRTWAKQRGRALKLMNVTPRVEQLLQVTRLKSEFEICSAREMLDLLCRGRAPYMAVRSSHRRHLHPADHQRRLEEAASIKIF